MSTNEKGTPQSRTYTVNDVAAILGIGRASAYKLANSGLFKTIRIGNRINEGWDDTVGVGVEKVKTFLRTLAKDENL